MAYVITDACRGNKHAACVDICPMDSIHPTLDEEEFASVDQLYIDPDVCIDCDLCAQECPVRAIYQENELPAGLERFKEINAAWFK